MEKLLKLVIVMFMLWAITLTPWGFDMGSKIFNNPFHNQVYCSVFSLMEKHPATKPSLKYWPTYLSKCMVVDYKKEKKIKEFLETNKKKLEKSLHKIDFELDKK